MKPSTFKALTGRLPQRSRPFSYPVQTRKALDVASVPHYWHPDRADVEHAPADFQQKLHDVAPQLHVCRPPSRAPIKQTWAVWMRKPTIQHPLCPGWLLLMLWESDDGRILPLDDRVLANIYLNSRGKWGSGKKYFDHCVETMKRDKAHAEKHHTDDRRDRQRDFRQQFKISSAGRGNKFARHHDGTIVPSVGQQNWDREYRRLWLPSDVRKDEEQRKEQRRAVRGS